MRHTRFLIVLGLLATVAATIYCTLLFIDNVSVAIQWRPVVTGAVHGVIPRFDWAAVDIACFATLIPALEMALISVGLIRILIPHERRCREHFPFFPGNQSIVIATGLMGAIFGIIMVAYIPLDNDKNNMTNLMVALRTALFSSLVALAWVYWVVPWVRSLMQAVYNRRATGPITEPPNIENAISRIWNELNSLSNAASSASSQIVSMGGDAVSASSSLSAVCQKLEEAAASANRFIELTSLKPAQDTAMALGAVLLELGKMTTAAEKISTGYMRVESLLERLNQEASQREEAWKKEAEVRKLETEAQKKALEAAEDDRLKRAQQILESQEKFAETLKKVVKDGQETQDKRYREDIDAAAKRTNRLQTAITGLLAAFTDESGDPAVVGRAGNGNGDGNRAESAANLRGAR